MKIFSEDKFTEPRDDCEHPEWWHATDEQSTEIEISELIAGFIRALQPEYAIETGACIGQTSHLIGLALKLNGHGWLDTLEPDNDVADYAEARCSGLPVTVHRQESLTFIPRAPIDFAFFDSLLDLRVPEFEYFKTYLNPGAVVAFHDTGPHKGEFGHEVRSIPELRYMQLNTPRGITLAQWR